MTFPAVTPNSPIQKLYKTRFMRYRIQQEKTEEGTQMKQRLTWSSIGEILQIWCDGHGLQWECTYLLDRASWDAHRRANRVRGIDLPASEWILYLANTGLFDVVNQTDFDDLRYSELLAYLRSHGLALQRLTPSYVRVYELRKQQRGNPV
jgi:hypothetical protein